MSSTSSKTNWKGRSTTNAGGAGELLNNFDQEVVEKVRISSEDYLGRFENWLWQLTRFFWLPTLALKLRNILRLERNPFEGERIHPGPYRVGKASRMRIPIVSAIP